MFSSLKSSFSISSSLLLASEEMHENCPVCLDALADSDLSSYAMLLCDLVILMACSE